MTAVEWFYQRILAKDIKEVFEQAKEMEKEQIKNTWYDCKMSIIDKNPTTADEYYNKTFKSE